MAAIGGAGFERPLGKATSFAFAADRVYVGTADSAAIDEYLANGSKRTIQLGIRPRAATRAHFDRAIELAAAHVPPVARERAAAAMHAIAMPATLPSYSGLLGDPDGIVWVIISAPGDAVTTLRALRPGGMPIADLQLPYAMTIFEIGADYILGTYEDGDLEPHVAVLRLRRHR
jgi:glutathione S-transferase